MKKTNKVLRLQILFSTKMIDMKTVEHLSLNVFYPMIGLII